MREFSQHGRCINSGTLSESIHKRQRGQAKPRMTGITRIGGAPRTLSGLGTPKALAITNFSDTGYITEPPARHSTAKDSRMRSSRYYFVGTIFRSRINIFTEGSKGNKDFAVFRSLRRSLRYLRFFCLKSFSFCWLLSHRPGGGESLV